MPKHPCTIHDSPLCQSIKLVHGFKAASRTLRLTPDDGEAREYIRFALLSVPEEVEGE